MQTIIFTNELFCNTQGTVHWSIDHTKALTTASLTSSALIHEVSSLGAHTQTIPLGLYRSHAAPVLWSLFVH